MLLYHSSFALPLLLVSGAFAEKGKSPRARKLAFSEKPWEDLKAMLDPSTVLLDVDAAKAYHEECLAEVAVNPSMGIHYALKDQPSGVCVMNIFCGLENCGLEPNDGNMTASDTIYEIVDPDPSTGPFVDPNAKYNIPTKVLFPRVAGDVVAAIRFAKENSVELSVKNSGHSYTGASTKMDTLHLNMRSYQNYSFNGPIACTEDDDGAIQEDLSNQPCKLARARNKPAAIRVGGGENWNMVYGNVKAFNEQQDSYMYHAVGGSAGSVSPMGWTWQGGLAGNMAGRMYGFGVDQVLQIEMVLPSGLLVKFGPTEWTDSDVSIYPKTKKVSGVCMDEDMRTWGACQEDVDFDDLWFAVRGGLGGSWGVVLSVFLQLHPHDPLNLLKANPNCVETLTIPAARDVYFHFQIDYYFDPSALGLSTDESIRCGAATEALSSYCYGEGAGDVFLKAFQSYVAEHNQTLQKDGNLTTEEVNSFANCWVMETHNDKSDQYQVMEGPYKGRAGDDGLNPYGTLPVQNILVPKKWILENKDKAASLMGANYAHFVAWAGYGASAVYYAFGGASASDEANALSEAHRKAGFMLMLPLNFYPPPVPGILPDLPPILASFYSELLPEMYDMSDKNNFPGYYGSNHAGQGSLGPLKSDWTQQCLTTWTQKEREEKCISLQEAIFGTERLERLEAIKKSIDPNFMFDCNSCVGNSRVKGSVLPATTTFESSLDDDLESAAVSSSKMMISFLLAAALLM